MGGVGREVASFPEVLQLLGWRDYQAREGMASRGLSGIQLLDGSVCTPLVHPLIVGCKIARLKLRNVANTLGLSCLVLINIVTVHSHIQQNQNSLHFMAKSG